MKHLSKIIVFLGALALGACSTSSTDKFVAGLTNFNRGLSAVDQTLKNVNATLYDNCTSFVTVAQAINDISGQCSKAAPYTSAANAVIDTYCSSSQLASNGGIAASIKVTADSIKVAKSTLAANKAACAN
jgi:Mrp family chromosome partitioning ATPase